MKQPFTCNSLHTTSSMKVMSKIWSVVGRHQRRLIGKDRQSECFVAVLLMRRQPIGNINPAEIEDDTCTKFERDGEIDF
jgi:hypothetical protein